MVNCTRQEIYNRVLIKEHGCKDPSRYIAVLEDSEDRLRIIDNDVLESLTADAAKMYTEENFMPLYAWDLDEDKKLILETHFSVSVVVDG